MATVVHLKRYLPLSGGWMSPAFETAPILVLPCRPSPVTAGLIQQRQFDLCKCPRCLRTPTAWPLLEKSDRNRSAFRAISKSSRAAPAQQRTRRFDCPYCGKVFHQNSNLGNRMRNRGRPCDRQRLTHAPTQ